MISINDLLEYIKNPKNIIAILLGLILIGGLSGALWISNLSQQINGLNQQVNTYKEVSEQRLKLAKEQNLALLNIISRQYKDFKNKVEDILLSIDNNNDSLLIGTQNIKQILDNQKDSILAKKIEPELNTILNDRNKYKGIIKAMELEILLTEKRLFNVIDEQKASTKWSFTYYEVLFLIILFFFIYKLYTYFFDIKIVLKSELNEQLIKFKGEYRERLEELERKRLELEELEQKRLELEELKRLEELERERLEELTKLEDSLLMELKLLESEDDDDDKNSDEDDDKNSDEDDNKRNDNS
ncbi:hypothetical protein [Flexithrix dorotheae]|uniref:hypothetical protein n=1 Tax=Flexithrix dorotheae TaxID=70993 RepID=UPI00036E028E|nr:hypothetical protein [Flexithrix dorotheae]